MPLPPKSLFSSFSSFSTDFFSWCIPIQLTANNANIQTLRSTFFFTYSSYDCVLLWSFFNLMSRKVVGAPYFNNGAIYFLQTFLKKNVDFISKAEKGAHTTFEVFVWFLLDKWCNIWHLWKGLGGFPDSNSLVLTDSRDTRWRWCRPPLVPPSGHPHTIRRRNWRTKSSVYTSQIVPMIWLV